MKYRFDIEGSSNFYGEYEVEADSYEEAEELAITAFFEEHPDAHDIDYSDGDELDGDEG